MRSIHVALLRHAGCDELSSSDCEHSSIFISHRLPAAIHHVMYSSTYLTQVEMTNVSTLTPVLPISSVMYTVMDIFYRLENSGIQTLQLALRRSWSVGLIGHLITLSLQILHKMWQRKIFKIGQYLAKLWTKVGCLLCWLTLYIKADEHTEQTDRRTDRRGYRHRGVQTVESWRTFADERVEQVCACSVVLTRLWQTLIDCALATKSCRHSAAKTSKCVIGLRTNQRCSHISTISN